MPETQFGSIIFCLVSAMSFSVGALWSLKRAGAARRKKIHPPAGFLAGALIFVSVYGLNRLAFPAFPRAALLFNLVLLSGILVFPELKKKLRRPRPKHAGKKQPLEVEALALERMLKIDPLNAYCFERLSELYEKMGKPDRALGAAREAQKLEPTVKNKLRVEELTRGGAFPAPRD